MKFERAARRRAKLRLVLTGVSGAGKTYSALLLAQGFGGRIAMIDTERGSGELYADLCKYDVLTLTPPFTEDKYQDALALAEKEGYDIVIIDSLTHAWAGQGGFLEQHAEQAAKTKNNYAAWKIVTPRYTRLIDSILQSPCHIIGTMRSKKDYAQQMVNGKTVITKLGTAPVFRDDGEYEFTTVLELNHTDHSAMVSKDRTNLFSKEPFRITPEIGKAVRSWLEQGDDPKPLPQPEPEPEPVEDKRPLEEIEKQSLKMRLMDAHGGDEKKAARGLANFLDRDINKIRPTEEEVEQYLEAVRGK